MSKKTKKKKKSPIKLILMIGLLCIAGALFILIGINVYVCLSAGAYISEDMDELPDKVDAIIVPGAGLTEDGKPGIILEDRLKSAVELYNKGISDRILMSGDHDDYHNEVQAMKDYAVEAGVPGEDVFMDHAGYNTYDTMYRAKAVFQVNSCVIVTQSFHLYRSVYIARGLGMDAYGYPSSMKVNVINYPSLEAREFLARIKEFFALFVKPLPTELDDPIPITGSGIQTDKIH